MYSSPVVIIDNKEPLVDIRRAGLILHGPAPEFPEVEPDYCLLREGIYQRLLRVDAALPAGHRLRLYEGFRSLSVQAKLFEREMLRVMEREPAFRPVEVHMAAKRMVAPVANWDGTPNVAPHSTGGAVDIELVDENGEVVDFGMQVRDWPSVEPAWCTLGSPLLSRTAMSNRMLLERAMAQEGFVRYHEQWWHFSYGDEYWAIATNGRIAHYGLCTTEMVLRARNS